MVFEGSGLDLDYSGKEMGLLIGLGKMGSAGEDRSEIGVFDETAPSHGMVINQFYFRYLFMYSSSLHLRLS